MVSVVDGVATDTVSGLSVGEYVVIARYDVNSVYQGGVGSGSLVVLDDGRVVDDCSSLSLWSNSSGYSVTSKAGKTCIAFPSRSSEGAGAYWSQLLSRDKEFDFSFKGYTSSSNGYVEFRFSDKNLSGGWSQNAFCYIHERTFGQTRQNGSNFDIRLEKIPVDVWTEINVYHDGYGLITVSFESGNSYTINQSYISGGWYFSPRAWSSSRLWVTDLEYIEY